MQGGQEVLAKLIPEVEAIKVLVAVLQVVNFRDEDGIFHDGLTEG